MDLFLEVLSFLNLSIIRDFIIIWHGNLIDIPRSGSLSGSLVVVIIVVVVVMIAVVEAASDVALPMVELSAEIVSENDCTVDISLIGSSVVTSGVSSEEVTSVNGSLAIIIVVSPVKALLVVCSVDGG